MDDAPSARPVVALHAGAYALTTFVAAGTFKRREGEKATLNRC